MLEAGMDDQTLTSLSTAATGASVGPFRLLEVIGEGGMGQVWLAEQTEPVRRRVAIKIIKAGMDTAHVVARFEAERQALALMDHPCIARVFEAGATVAGRPYFAMEHVHGESITAYSDRHRLSTKERLALFIQVCDGVNHAHQKGIIHRDLKPTNILVTSTDDKAAVKIIDFGLAKAMSTALTDHTVFTSLGGFVGTPEYMSPEQALGGSSAVDTRTDIYALGVVLYQLLTGFLPFDAGMLRKQSVDEIRRTLREVTPSRPSTRVSGSVEQSVTNAASRRTDPGRLAQSLRGDLDWIVMKALDKEPNQRFASASEFAADVRRHLASEPVTARPHSFLYSASRFTRRHKYGVLSAASIVLLLAAFAVMMTLSARALAVERDRANAQAQRASHEAAVAASTANFLTSLFRVADPGEARGENLTALEILDRGARRLETELVDEPLVRADLLNTIGNVYSSLGQHQRREGVARRVLEIRRATLGETHRQTLYAHANLAGTLIDLRQLHEGERHLAIAYDGFQKSADASDVDRARIASRFAALRTYQGRLAEAEELHKQVVSLRARTLGATHESTLEALSNVAVAQHLQGKVSEAAHTYSDVLEAQRRLLGANHPATLLTLANLAEASTALGDLDRAEQLFAEALNGSRKVLPPTHSALAMTLLHYADLRLVQRSFAEAEAMLRESVAIYQQDQSLSDYLALAESRLGEALLHQGRLSAAEPLLLRGAHGVQRSQELPSTEKRLAVERVVRLYEKWNRPRDAATWRAKQ